MESGRLALWLDLRSNMEHGRLALWLDLRSNMEHGCLALWLDLGVATGRDARAPYFT